ncbi:TIGR03086 family metal-binding protein [Streptomyces albulus]|uniref:TIGR03086 family metal-binding protein n=1 Tax=Streptomyces noursei TaxID=1971 RepID=UPI001F1E8955|nr:TIGR03086 family metal-binding protein [Streptomyces noursei]MCE4945227.1 TIGR03086 family metal-binding protein [Streptomyces noursei]
MTEKAAPPTPPIDFAAQAREVARLAAGTADAQLAAPTPCPAYAVRHLLGHLAGLAVAFRDAARKDLGPTTDTPPDTELPDVAPGWRAELARNLDELAAAWRVPAAWEGETRVGGVTLPGAAAGRFALNELVLHGWDLARATGQRYAPDGASLEVAHGLLAAVADEARDGSLFGPAVPVAPDAPLLDRVVALGGRAPAWTAAPAAPADGDAR